MISLNHKAFYWEKFDEDEKPINPKECQIVFNPKDGGKLLFFLDVNERLINDDIKDKKIEVLYGQTQNGKKLTLNNLKFMGARQHMNGYLELTEVEYSVEYIFYDGWVKLEQLLDIIYVRYSYMELWFNQMELKYPEHKYSKTFAGIVIHEEQLECSSKDYDVLFNIKNGLKQNSFNDKVVIYEVTNSLTIVKKDDFQINEAVDIANGVKSFFEIVTFYSRNKIFIEDLYFTQKRRLKNGFEDVEFVYLLFKQDDYIEEQEMSHLDFLFRYTDIKDDFVRILNNWIERHGKNQNEYGAFCKVIADKNTKFNIYSHYFQLISALEGYQRRNDEGLDENKGKEHEKYIEDLKLKLKDCLNPKERKSLFYKLKYSNKTTLKQRISDLIEQSDIKQLIILEEDVHNLIFEFIIQVRNDIAHLNDNNGKDEKLKGSF